MTNKLVTVLRWGLYLCALVPLVIFKDYLSPFHFGKVVMFRALVEIMLVFYVALILTDRRFLPKPSPLFWALTAFTAAFGITSLTGVNVYQSIMGTLERMGGWFTFLHFWVLYVIAISVLKTKEDWIRLIQVSVVASLLSSCYGFLQKTNWDLIVGSGNRARIFGTLGNTALFAGYILIHVYLALFLALRSDKDSRYIWYGIFGVNVLAVFMTAVRGSVAGLLLSLALFALFYTMAGTSRKIKTTFIGVAVVLILFELILISAHNSNFVKSSGYLTRLSDISLKTRLINTRFWAWGAGIDGWNDSFKTVVFGWGPENFNVPFSVHFNPKFFQGPSSETLFDRAHNMFVEVLVTMGLVGFIAYIAIFMVLFWMLWRIWKDSGDHEYQLFAMVFAPGLVAYIVHNSFIFDTSGNFIAFFLMAGFIGYFFMTRTGTAVANTKAPVQTAPATLRYSAAFILGILAIVSIYQTDIKPAEANYATTRAIVASWGGDHAKAVAKFREALAYDTFPAYEIRHRYAQYVLENYGSFKSDQGLNPGQLLLEVIEETKKNESYQLDYLPYLYISRAYIVLGKGDPKSPFNDLALENSKKALEISPTFVRTYYEVAQAYLNKKDYTTAAQYFQKAVDLNPEVGLSWWYLGLTRIESGDEQQGFAAVNKALSLGYGMGENDYLRLIGIYTARKDFPKLIGLYEQLIKLNGNVAQYHASLAAIYAQLGKIDDAVKQAKIAAQLDPANFEKEARAFVAQLGRQW